MDLFRFLVESGIVTAAFIIGAVGFIVALVGKFKDYVDLSQLQRISVALFALLLMALSYVAYQQTMSIQYQTPTPVPEIVQHPSPTALVKHSGPTLDDSPTPGDSSASDATTPIPPSPPTLCYGSCWSYDHENRTMTWTGPTDGTEDIWQPEGGALEYIRGGYTAIFQTTVPLRIALCVGELDGVSISKQCVPTIQDIAPGTHRVNSPGQQGGFRVGPDPKFAQ